MGQTLKKKVSLRDTFYYLQKLNEASNLTIETYLLATRHFYRLILDLSSYSCKTIPSSVHLAGCCLI